MELLQYGQQPNKNNNTCFAFAMSYGKLHAKWSIEPIRQRKKRVISKALDYGFENERFSIRVRFIGLEWVGIEYGAARKMTVQLVAKNLDARERQISRLAHPVSPDAIRIFPRSPFPFCLQNQCGTAFPNGLRLASPS